MVKSRRAEVLLEGLAELDPVRAASIAVLDVATERRHLDRVTGFDGHEHGAEAILVVGIGEERQESLRSGIRGHVPVVRRAAEERVAERAADDVASMAADQSVSRMGITWAGMRSHVHRARAQSRPRKR